MPTTDRKSDDKSREESRGVYRKCELDLFVQWAAVRAKLPPPRTDESRHEAEKFFDNNVSYQDPLPPAEWREDPLLHGKVFPSYFERRMEQWDKKFKVEFDGSLWSISKVE